MQAFQKMVLGIAVVALIVLLALIGMSLSSTNKTNWPPVVGDCPDYWVDMSGNGSACYNAHQLGTCGLAKTDANEDVKVTLDLSGYTDCDKYNWAKNCGLTWDGITSGVSNPCTDTEPAATA
jgi:hypothetical protein